MRYLRLGLVCALVLACSHAPKEPSPNCAQQVGCATVVSPLSPEEAATWVEKARAEVSTDLGRACTTPAPRIVYRACPFWVPNASIFGPVCAAGMTDWRHDTIYISTFEPSRTGPLVYWEARNYFWCRNGLCRKAV